MRLAKSLAAVASFAPEKFEDLRRNVDPDWIEQALAASGTATLRRRRMPAAQVVWLVIGMALFRNRSIHDIVGKLNLVLPGRCATVAASSVVEARARLREEPLNWIFTPLCRGVGPIRVPARTPGEVWRSMAAMAPFCASRTQSRIVSTLA